MTEKRAGLVHQPAEPEENDSIAGSLRQLSRELALRSALRKRAAGVPSYTIPEAAALCSVSQEHLYRLVRADAFPAVRMQRGDGKGRYVIPAKAVEQLLNDAVVGGGCVEASEWAAGWSGAASQPAGGAA
ncbi:helix-turn-helix domain-containing protein [Kribbella lupini]|uniref:Helix-turn-helix domain-containing protein n=1 Tax=Kribbella lupini TaxID=291602 RepID=A0ABN2B192_9ACTN